MRKSRDRILNIKSFNKNKEKMIKNFKKNFFFLIFGISFGIQNYFIIFFIIKFLYVIISLIKLYLNSFHYNQLI
jgi:hypothetical protein